MTTSLEMFKGSNLTQVKGKYDVWLVNQCIPSYCAFVVCLFVLGHMRVWHVDYFYYIYIVCALIVYCFLLSCGLVYIYSYLYISTHVCVCLYIYALHDYFSPTWCMFACLYGINIYPPIFNPLVSVDLSSLWFCIWYKT